MDTTTITTPNTNDSSMEDGSVMGLSLLDHIRAWLVPSHQDLSRPLHPSQRTALMTQLERAEVEVEYGDTPRHRKQQRQHKVIGVSRLGADRQAVLFPEEGAKRGLLTIAEYFKQVHGRLLMYPGLNCIEVQPNVFVPIELVRIVSLPSMHGANLYQPPYPLSSPASTASPAAGTGVKGAASSETTPLTTAASGGITPTPVSAATGLVPLCTPSTAASTTYSTTAISTIATSTAPTAAVTTSGKILTPVPTATGLVPLCTPSTAASTNNSTTAISTIATSTAPTAAVTTSGKISIPVSAATGLVPLSSPSATTTTTSAATSTTVSTTTPSATPTTTAVSVSTPTSPGPGFISLTTTPTTVSTTTPTTTAAGLPASTVTTTTTASLLSPSLSSSSSFSSPPFFLDLSPTTTTTNTTTPIEGHFLLDLTMPSGVLGLTEDQVGVQVKAEVVEEEEDDDEEEEDAEKIRAEKVDDLKEDVDKENIPEQVEKTQEKMDEKDPEKMNAEMVDTLKEDVKEDQKEEEQADEDVETAQEKEKNEEEEAEKMDDLEKIGDFAEEMDALEEKMDALVKMMGSLVKIVKSAERMAYIAEKVAGLAENMKYYVGIKDLAEAEDLGEKSTASAGKTKDLTVAESELLAEKIGALVGKMGALEKEVEGITEKLGTLGGKMGALDRMAEDFVETMDALQGTRELVGKMEALVDTEELLEKQGTLLEKLGALAELTGGVVELNEIIGMMIDLAETMMSTLVEMSEFANMSAVAEEMATSAEMIWALGEMGKLAEKMENIARKIGALAEMKAFAVKVVAWKEDMEEKEKMAEEEETETKQVKWEAEKMDASEEDVEEEQKEEDEMKQKEVEEKEAVKMNAEKMDDYHAEMTKGLAVKKDSPEMVAFAKMLEDFPRMKVSAEKVEALKENVEEEEKLAEKRKDNDGRREEDKGEVNEGKAKDEEGLTDDKGTSASQEMDDRRGPGNRQRRVDEGRQLCHNPAALHTWALYCYDPQITNSELATFLVHLKEAGRSRGVEVPGPVQLQLPPSRHRPTHNPLTELQDLAATYPGLQMVMVVVNNSSMYGRVKVAGDLCLGVVTQCVSPSSVRRLCPSTLTNLVEQVNSKLGGSELRAPRITWPPQLAPSLVVMALHHDAPREWQGMMVGAVVASANLTTGQFITEVQPQASRDTAIADLTNMTCRMLESLTGQYERPVPEQILVYSDGTDKGQVQRESRAVEEACRRFMSNYSPRITWVGVYSEGWQRWHVVSKTKPQARNYNVSLESQRCDEDKFTITSSDSQSWQPVYYKILWDTGAVPVEVIQGVTKALCQPPSTGQPQPLPRPLTYACLAANRCCHHMKTLRLNWKQRNYAELSRDIGRMVTVRATDAIAHRRYYI